MAQDEAKFRDRVNIVSSPLLPYKGEVGVFLCN